MTTDKLLKKLGKTRDPEKRRPLIAALSEAGVIIDWNCGFSCIWRVAAEPGTCAAFPKGVPPDFANGVAIHDHSVPGDGGLIYSSAYERLTPEQLDLWMKHLLDGVGGEISDKEGVE